MCEECPLGLSAFLSTRPPKGLKNIRYFCSILGHFSTGGSEGVPPTRPDHGLPGLQLWTFQGELIFTSASKVTAIHGDYMAKSKESNVHDNIMKSQQYKLSTALGSMNSFNLEGNTFKQSVLYEL